MTNHLKTCESSLFSDSSILDILIGIEYSIVVNKVVSSAYKINLKAWLTFMISFIYIKNNRGPSIDPCGTPVVIFCFLDAKSFSSTYWSLFVR